VPPTRARCSASYGLHPCHHDTDHIDEATAVGGETFGAHINLRLRRFRPHIHQKESDHLDPNPDYDASDEIEYGINWFAWILRGVYPPPACPPV
jgi:hypothetical protein